MRYSSKSFRDIPEADVHHLRIRIHHVELFRIRFQSLDEITVDREWHLSDSVCFFLTQDMEKEQLTCSHRTNGRCAVPDQSHPEETIQSREKEREEHYEGSVSIGNSLSRMGSIFSTSGTASQMWENIKKGMGCSFGKDLVFVPSIARVASI